MADFISSHFAYSILIFLFAFIVDRSSTQSLSKKCAEIRGKVAVNPGGSQSRLLPDCLFKYLKEKAASETGDDDYALTSNAPPQTGDKELPVKISSIRFANIERMRTEHISIWISGRAELSWTDSRLAWNKFEWNAEHLKLSGQKKIWVPRFVKMGGSGVFGTFQNGQIRYNGTVNADMDFTIRAICYELPGELIPTEHFGCCSKFATTDVQFVFDDAQKSVIQLEAHMPGRLRDPTFIGGKLGSDLPEIWKHLLSQDDMKKLHFCAKIANKSKLQIARYVLPVFGIGMILLAAQMFPKMLMQLSVKLLSLLLQFLCFSRLLPTNKSSAVIETRPIVYSAYWLTFVVSLISILLTIVSMRLASIDYESALPWFCQSLVNFTSKYIAFGGNFGGETDSDEKSYNTYHESWNRFISLLHNLLCLVLNVIYCVALIGLFM